MDYLAKQFELALLAIDRVKAEELLRQAIEKENSIECIEKLIIPALTSIGEGWENDSVALSQVYMSGRICEEIIDTVLPPADSRKIDTPLIAITTLEDYHFLGKRIIYSTLKACGIELTDYGRLDNNELVEKVISDNIKILLISILMLPSALQVKRVCKQLKEKNTRIKIIVGGAPFRFDRQLWKEVGADATGANSSEAIKIVNNMIEGLS
jgi:methanogenic corrinoid protein MtbC1